MESEQLDLFEALSPATVAPSPTMVECPTCSGRGVVCSAEALAYMPGMVSNNHPSPSVKAAHQNRIRFGSQRHRALEALQKAGPMTAAEVAVHIGVSRNQTATRLLELHRVGLVKYLLVDGVRVTRPTGPRDEGLVHEVTAAGAAFVVD